MKIKTLFYNFIIISLSLLMVSCITSKDINYLQEPSKNIPRYRHTKGYEEYVLSPFDKLYIRVYSLDKKTNFFINGGNENRFIQLGGQGDARTELYTYVINENGNVDLPLLGEVKLAGLYIRQAKKVLRNAVKAYTIDECAVDVKLIGRYFSIIGGDVNGKFPIYKEKMNIFQAVALAGGIGTFGDRSKVKILREAPNGVQIRTFDLRSKDIIYSDFYYIQPNDVLYIQEVNSQFFSVTNIGAAFSTITTTISFGLLVYNISHSLSASKEKSVETPEPKETD